jgi:hypothetical protein
MIPRVQTFAWRLLRQAIPTATRVAARSNHVLPYCRRCGLLEDDIHLFFTCDFARAVWFISPICLRVDGILQQGPTTVSHFIQFLLDNYKDPNSLELIFLILWFIWKARCDYHFNAKEWKVLQVIHAAKAQLTEGIQEIKTQGEVTTDQIIRKDFISLQIDKERVQAGPNIYTDAAWKNNNTSTISNSADTPQHAGLGVFIIFEEDGINHAIYIAAKTTANSVLHAEAKAMELGSSVAEALHLRRTNYLTDNFTLAEAAAKREPNNYRASGLL